MPCFSTSGGGDQFELRFNAGTNASFSVWAPNNLEDWQWEGPATAVNAGNYQFFDPAATNAPNRFHRLSAP